MRTRFVTPIIFLMLLGLRISIGVKVPQFYCMLSLVFFLVACLFFPLSFRDGILVLLSLLGIPVVNREIR